MCQLKGKTEKTRKQKKKDKNGVQSNHALLILNNKGSSRSVSVRVNYDVALRASFMYFAKLSLCKSRVRCVQAVRTKFGLFCC